MEQQLSVEADELCTLIYTVRVRRLQRHVQLMGIRPSAESKSLTHTHTRLKNSTARLTIQGVVGKRKGCVVDASSAPGVVEMTEVTGGGCETATVDMATEVVSMAAVVSAGVGKGGVELSVVRSGTEAGVVKAGVLTAAMEVRKGGRGVDDVVRVVKTETGMGGGEVPGLGGVSLVVSDGVEEEVVVGVKGGGRDGVGGMVTCSVEEVMVLSVG